MSEKSSSAETAVAERLHEWLREIKAMRHQTPEELPDANTFRALTASCTLPMMQAAKAGQGCDDHVKMM